MGNVNCCACVGQGQVGFIEQVWRGLLLLHAASRIKDH
jgi:hypothetical protein